MLSGRIYMVWSRTILDGIVLMLIFNAVVAVAWMLFPSAFSSMAPKEIQKAAPPLTKKDYCVLAAVLVPLNILIPVYMIVSSHLSGVTGFWNLFWTAYIETFFINMGDFWGLDVWFRGIAKDKIMIPGTEHCKAWETKEWLKALAIPEHWILWPFVACPMFGLVVAGIRTWIF